MKNHIHSPTKVCERTKVSADYLSHNCAPDKQPRSQGECHPLAVCVFRHFNDECKRTLSPQLGIQLFLELRSIFSNKTKRQIVSY